MKFSVGRLLIVTAIVADSLGLVIFSTKGDLHEYNCWIGWHGVAPAYRVIGWLEGNCVRCPFYRLFTVGEYLAFISMTAALVILVVMLRRPLR